MNAPIQGATTILSPLQVLNNPDLPVADMQHIAGGKWSLPDVASRDQIPAALRQANITECYVIADEKTYVLRGGITNANWHLKTSTTGSTGGTGSTAKLLNRFLPSLVMTVGQSFTLDLPDDLFGPAPVVYASLEVQNLPDGLTLGAPARIAGTPTAVGTGILLLNAVLQTGEHLQYAVAYKTSDAANVVSTVGVVAIDVSFGAMNPQELTSLVYDFDLALQLNEPALAENGQRAVPGVSGRFMGDQSVTNCLAVAAIAKQTVPGNAAIRFYRFGISTARLRQLYPNRVQFQFDLRGKRKATNPAGVGNGVYFRVGRDLTSGLLSAAQPIGFTSNNPTAAGAPVDYNNSGNLFGVNDTETVLGQFIVQPLDGLVLFIPVAVAPVAAAVLGVPSVLPTGLPTGMTLTYNEVTGATGYESQYSVQPDAVGNSVVSTGLSRTVNGLLVDTPYYSRVRALGANGAASPWSGIVSVAPGGQVTTLDSITTASAWLVTESYSRDGNSKDTSIWLKGSTATQPYEVALVREDGNPVAGQNWSSGVFGPAELTASLPYATDPAYTAVKRFNTGTGTGVTPGNYLVKVRRPELPLVVLTLPVLFGGSTNGITLIAQYQAPAVQGGGGGPTPGGGSSAVTITPSTATPPWLIYLGWNRDVAGGPSDGDTNVFWESTEALKARILENGVSVANASWVNPAAFMAKYTGDAYVPGGHTARIRLQTGIREGHTYSIELIRESNAADPFTILWTPVREAGIHPFTLPTVTSGGGADTTTSPVSNTVFSDYDGGISDSVTGVTDPDGQVSDNTVLDPNPVN